LNVRRKDSEDYFWRFYLGIILACIQENPCRTVIAAEKRITMINQLRRILDILPTLQQALEQSTCDLLKNLCSVGN
jgi:hypothetical protein